MNLSVAKARMILENCVKVIDADALILYMSCHAIDCVEYIMYLSVRKSNSQRSKSPYFEQIEMQMYFYICISYKMFKIPKQPWKFLSGPLIFSNQISPLGHSNFPIPSIGPFQQLIFYCISNSWNGPQNMNLIIWGNQEVSAQFPQGLITNPLYGNNALGELYWTQCIGTYLCDFSGDSFQIAATNCQMICVMVVKMMIINQHWKSYECCNINVVSDSMWW